MESIRKVEQNKEAYLPLLRLADESDEMIARYLQRGEMYLLEANGEAACVCMVTDEGGGVCEVQNLATAPGHRRKGYAGRMLGYIAGQYRGRFAMLRLGTGAGSSQQRFYEKLGFEAVSMDKDYFVRQYKDPIIEDGVQLRDRVLMHKKL